MLQHVTGFSSLLQLDNLLNVYTILVYPFVSWWALGLLLSFGCCEYYCSEHTIEISVQGLALQFFWGYIAGSCDSPVLKNHHAAFHSGCTYLHSLCTAKSAQAVHCLHSLANTCYFLLFYNGHPDGGKIDLTCILLMIRVMLNGFSCAYWSFV